MRASQEQPAEVTGPLGGPFLRVVEHEIEVFVQAGEAPEEQALVLELDLHAVVDQPLQLGDGRRHGGADPGPEDNLSADDGGQGSWSREPPTAATSMVDAAPGLEDIVIGRSAISRVGGATGELEYRGYSIADVVGHLGYEGTVELLWTGRPPDPGAPSELGRRLAARRAIPAEQLVALDRLPAEMVPMDALRTALSILGGAARTTYPPTESQGIDLVARAATALAHLERRRTGRPPVPPRPELGHVANYLAMLTGAPPDPRRVWALESYFDLVADHGMNASTFALRVVLSTQADLFSAATAAIGALKGPLHGGAPERVLDMLDRVGDPASATDWVRAALDRGERLMGFGHRAYKAEDPRAVLLRRIAEEVAPPSRYALARAVESAALAELGRRKPGQRLFTNVEFYAAVVLEAAGLARELFPPTFAVARTAGWVAHALEQASANRLIRPEVAYAGPTGQRFPDRFPSRPVPAE